MDLQRLLDMARGGDRAAWNEILSALRPTVRGWLQRRLRQDADASDLTNVVQLRMDRGFARFRGETTGQLRAWTWRITLNVLNSHRRLEPPAPVPLPDALPAPPAATPIVSQDDIDRLRKALEHLPLHYRTVVEGRLFDGLSCVEIAQRMHELPGTVRVWCCRAVKELRKRLGTGT
jgi:RNA polymerase sigma-70 factor (ECF subfamily)